MSDGQHVTIYVPPEKRELLNDLKNQAEARDRSLSNYLLRLLTKQADRERRRDE